MPALSFFSFLMSAFQQNATHKKIGKGDLIHEAEIDTDEENKSMDTEGGRGVG